ncbi:phosphate ABC transporter substrate-binding/OmpA family protein [Ideonella sp. DXS29W]|uniref:Phosphate ABC transporter substrate-binding/OmpA family protein n=1 Tax=Ideonella lacteola TaxID=2984193 RepID=A0ABU9BWW6_9BURK
MAYQMTGLTKGLLLIIGLGLVGSIGWNFVLKDKLKKEGITVAGTTLGGGGNAANDTGGGNANAGGAAPARPAAAAGGKLGSPGNPLKVSIVSFHGYAPALVANGNSLKTQPGSIYAKLGVNVEFVINDDIPTLTTLFEAKTAQCAWRTSDFWAQEQPNLRNSGHDGRGVMLVDNTQGGDAVIARDNSIQKIEDLAGKTVALLQYTPSHGMLIDAIDNASLTARQKRQIKTVFIKPEEGTAGVRAAFTAGNVDAAVLWDPDLSLALRETKGAHVVYSTKTATNLIYDMMVCDQRELAKPENEPVFQAFVDGWMEGVTAARANPDNAVKALVETEEFFKLLAAKEGTSFIKSLFNNLLWTDLADNARILGLAGGVNHYERVYARFDQIYRGEGSLANPKSPVIPPQDSIDLRFIKKALQRNTQAQAEAVKPTETFTEKGQAAALAAPAQVTKPVSVNFASGSFELSKKAQQVIDKEMVPFIENNGSAYFEVGGNTDSVGSAGANQALSLARARAVADYLEKQWEVPRARLKVTGYGSSRPLCDETRPEAADMTLDACRALNRSTRLAVFSK